MVDTDGASPAASATALLADRYGRRSRGGPRRGLIAVIVVFVVAALAWAGWVGLQTARTPVRWQDGTFTALDDGRARYTFSVTTDPGRAVVCTVRIFNRGLTEVGRLDVTAGPSDHRTFAVTAEVPTFELGTSGSVRGCVPR